LRHYKLGYVHRDVKLENLLIQVPGDLSTLKLADFGFATAVSNAAGRRGAAFAAKDFTGDRLQGKTDCLCAPHDVRGVSVGCMRRVRGVYEECTGGV
jgi:serine/threonine protein kinase